jgi:hypothetical protein
MRAYSVGTNRRQTNEVSGWRPTVRSRQSRSASSRLARASVIASQSASSNSSSTRFFVRSALRDFCSLTYRGLPYSVVVSS